MNDDNFGADMGRDEIALEVKKHQEAMEEAVAEEAFIASGEEDSFDNPLVPVNKEIEKMALMGEEESADDTLDGAFGSGGLNPVGAPFNNEEALLDEDPIEKMEEPKEKEEMMPKEPETPVAPAPKTPEPVVAEPASEPAPTPVTETSAPVATAPAAAPADKPKKKKGGLIAIIIILILLIGGGVAAFLLYRAHEAPERQINDAIAHLYEADATQFNGTITIVPNPKASVDSGINTASMISEITITFDTASKGSNGSGSGTLSTKFMNKELKVTLSGAYVSSTGIYFKVDGLKKSLEDSGLLGILMLMMGGYSSNSAMDPSSMINTVLTKLEDGWYKIDASTFKDGSEDQKTFNCEKEALNNLMKVETKKKISDIYKKHPVILYDDSKESKSEDGLTYFYVKGDKAKAEELSKEVQNLEEVKALSACSTSDKKEEGGEETDDEDVTETETPEQTKSEIQLGITGWTHELKAIKGSSSNSSVKVTYNVKISYDDKAVAEPSDAKNFKKLIEELTELVGDYYEDMEDLGGSGGLFDGMSDGLSGLTSAAM